MKYRPRHRFLSMEKLEEAAKGVAALAKRQGIKTAIAGGFACQMYGSPRLTGDLDILSSKATIRGLPRGKALSFGGHSTELNGIPIDIIVRDDDYTGLYNEALRTSVRSDFGKIVKPEYLAAMKLATARDKDELDLKFLIEHAVILADARRVIRKYLGLYAVDEFNRIVDEVDWEKSRGRE